MADQKQLKFDLLVIGELNMDLILDDVESFPEIGKEKTASGLNITLGSSSAIFASNIARLGINTAFCGMIGQDNFGEAVLRELRKSDIDTTFVQVTSEYETGLTVIIRHKGDRAMVTYPGAMEHFSLQDIPEEAFQTARHLHISSIFLQPGVKRDLFDIVEKAKSHDMTISVDPQWDPKEEWDLDIEKLLNQIDFFFPNEAEFLHLSGSETVSEGLEKLKSQIAGCLVVKRGKQGVTFLSNGSTKTIPAFENREVVDAIGAGDSFNAGFIYQFLRGSAIENCVQFGNMTGAVSTTQAGGTAAMKSMDEVLKIAKNKFSITDIDDITG
jgi:sugar/nucleoside kinase (ribokinase family)